MFPRNLSSSHRTVALLWGWSHLSELLLHSITWLCLCWLPSSGFCFCSEVAKTWKKPLQFYFRFLCKMVSKSYLLTRYSIFHSGVVRAWALKPLHLNPSFFATSLGLAFFCLFTVGLYNSTQVLKCCGPSIWNIWQSLAQSTPQHCGRSHYSAKSYQMSLILLPTKTVGRGTKKRSILGSLLQVYFSNYSKRPWQHVFFFFSSVSLLL